MEELKKVAALALDALKAAGADDACVTAITAETREFNVDSGEFSLFRTLFDNSLRLTAFRAHKRGTATLNRFDEESIRTAAAECLETAESGAPDEAWTLAPEGLKKEFASEGYTPDLDKFFSRCRELMDGIKAEYPLVLMEQMVLQHRGYREVYLNTNGAEFTAVGGEYSVSLDFSGHNGEKGSSFFGGGFATLDLDKPFIDQWIVRRSLADAENSIDTVPVEGKFTGTIVLTPDCAMETIGTALSLFAGDVALIGGTSIWKDKLGGKVAADCVTLSSAPRDSRIIGGECWTAEGFVSEDYDIIKGGVLQSFMLGQYASNRTGLPRAKNNDDALILLPGEKSLDEIIASIPDGLLVGRFSGGEPNAAGDFSGVAKNSFRIKDGKLVGAVSETMISGNLSDLLLNIVGISKETVCDGSSVMPWVAASGVVISGK